MGESVIIETGEAGIDDDGYLAIGENGECSSSNCCDSKCMVHGCDVNSTDPDAVELDCSCADVDLCEAWNEPVPDPGLSAISPATDSYNENGGPNDADGSHSFNIPIGWWDGASFELSIDYEADSAFVGPNFLTADRVNKSHGVSATISTPFGNFRLGVESIILISSATQILTDPSYTGPSIAGFSTGTRFGASVQRTGQQELTYGLIGNASGNLDSDADQLECGIDISTSGSGSATASISFSNLRRVQGSGCQFEIDVTRSVTGSHVGVISTTHRTQGIFGPCTDYAVSSDGFNFWNAPLGGTDSTPSDGINEACEYSAGSITLRGGSLTEGNLVDNANLQSDVTFTAGFGESDSNPQCEEPQPGPV